MMARSTTTNTSTPDYTMGYGDEFIRVLARYAKSKHSKYLIPHLRPGLQVLDVGCGPGFQAMDFAEAIAPGELFGIDIEPSQIEMAQQLAEERGHDNATFAVADVVDLPFEEGFFDVAHCGGVLGFLPDTAAALAEIKRTLRPGGLVVCRDMIVESCFAHPDLGLTFRGWEMLSDLIAADDGHPQMGKDIKEHLANAGFEEIRMSASFNMYDTPEEIELFYQLVKGWFLEGDPASAAKKYGAATDGLLAQVSETLDIWRSSPGAVAGIAFGRALAVRP